MTVTSLLDALLQRDLPRSLEIFVPELLLCATIVALLLVRLFGCQKRIPSCWVALIGSLLAFMAVFAQFKYVVDGGAYDEGMAASLYQWFGLSESGAGLTGESYFVGMLRHDEFALCFRAGLSLFLVLMVSLTVLTGIPDQEDGQDFYALMMGATIGMMMASGANHLLMLFLSVEMMSVPSYVMVGFLKGQKRSSEAALKYVVFGAGSAGIMLYGISLIAGLLGTADFSALGERLAFLMQNETFGLKSPTAVTAVLGVMMVLVGLAFKLSLVPFHFWCPDAFEGAPAEVGGFLSVASKAGAFALLVRFVTSFTGPEPVLHEFSLFFGLALAVVAVLSMTLGNLAAYAQTNMKRLLAYSTIAHAGYMVLAVGALLVVSSVQPGDETYERFASYATGITQAQGTAVEAVAARTIEGLMYYLAVYLFMNLAAFAVVSLIRNVTYREDIDAYRGLSSAGPATMVLSVCLAVSFFSLVGLPPFGGFFAKLMIFMSAFNAGFIHWLMWAALAIAGLNTVFSLFYYMRVLKAVFILPAPEDQRPVQVPGLESVYVVLITLPLIALGMSPLQEVLSQKVFRVAEALFR